MNRKQRRAAAKHGGARPGGRSVGGPVTAQLAEIQANGLAHHQAGRLTQAEACYRKVLAAEPSNVNALHLLGVLARQVGQHRAAVDLISRAVSLNDRVPELHCNLGNALMDLGRTAEAEACYRQALALKPDYAAAHNNLGNVLQGRGEHKQAEACYQHVLALEPDQAQASCHRTLAPNPDLAAVHGNLGNALLMQGRSVEAEACCRHALTLEPAYPEGHNNPRQRSPGDQGRLDVKPRSATGGRLDLKPDLAEAHNNLGLVLKDDGKPGDAEACYRRAIALKPGFTDALCNLGNLLLDLGEIERALDVAHIALGAKEAGDAKTLFVRCIGRFAEVQSISNVGALRGNLVRALMEPWGRPSDLAGFAAHALKQDQTIGRCVKRANDAWPNRLSGSGNYRGRPDWLTIADDRLLICLLESTPVCDIELERFLTAARFTLLQAATATPDPGLLDDAMLKVGCALARQCFINEYVFAVAAGEFSGASAAIT